MPNTALDYFGYDTSKISSVKTEIGSSNDCGTYYMDVFDRNQEKDVLDKVIEYSG